MPNRILKESICKSEEIDNCTYHEETFFYRLIVNCDDYGRFDARPKILIANCFPLRIDKMKISDIEQLLNSLASKKLIILYEVNNKPYLQMTTWAKHQQIRSKRSKYPSPEEGSIKNSCVIIPTKEVPSPKAIKDYIEEFEELWKLYPKKKGKGQILDSKKKQLHKLGFETLKTCIERYVDENKGKDIQFLQNGSTFFNSGYIDYLEGNYQDIKGGESNGTSNGESSEYNRQNKSKWLYKGDGEPEE